MTIVYFILALDRELAPNNALLVEIWADSNSYTGWVPTNAEKTLTGYMSDTMSDTDFPLT